MHAVGLTNLKLSNDLLLLCCSQLMAKEPLEKLGFRDLKETPPSQEDKEAKE